MIVHPGSAKKASNKQKGIEIIARNLNAILKHESEVKIILENTAHAGLSIGGDLQDFLHLRERLEHPESIAFCIDTAHAYSYGYDISNAKGQQSFIDIINTTIGLNNVGIIHLNDTKQEFRISY